jgi:hypothetical protein
MRLLKTAAHACERFPVHLAHRYGENAHGISSCGTPNAPRRGT